MSDSQSAQIRYVSSDLSDNVLKYLSARRDEPLPPSISAAELVEIMGDSFLHVELILSVFDELVEESCAEMVVGEGGAALVRITPYGMMAAREIIPLEGNLARWLQART